MPLPAGAHLGPYEIVGPLGRGGMGEVYKARDSRLNRDVAIKILRADRVADPDRKARFIQEARAASALNHPNIVTIYDISEAEGVDFLVMEFVPGQTLEQMIGRKGLPPATALRYAIPVCDALSKAHASGIVHRDLKPGNIMVSTDGVVKVLDFGLAKLTEPNRQDDEDATVTVEGMIAGTIAYMSPEQAQAKPVDHRSDIFSFGCVLYEMVTARRAFQGETQATTLAAILRDEPKAVSQVTANVPAEVTKIIARCLRKDPARRFQGMADLKVALEDAKEESDSGVVALPAPVRRRSSLVWVALGIALLAAGGALWSWARKDSAAEVFTPAPLTTEAGTARSPSFSPDGSQVAYAWDGESHDNPDIYVKLTGTERPLRLTTSPEADVDPAWSPDGRSIAFIRNGSGIYVVPPIGGVERKIVDGNFGRASWFPNSKLLAAAETVAGQPVTLYTINVESGDKRPLLAPPAGMRYAAPAVSPDGHRLAFLQCHGTFSCAVYVVGLTDDYRASGVPALIGEGNGQAGNPAWTADGRDLVYAFGTTTARARLFRSRAETGAKPQLLAFAGEHVRMPAISLKGGRLAYGVTNRQAHLRRIGPDGGVNIVSASTGSEDFSPQYSPDGRRIVFTSDRSGGTHEIWVTDAEGRNALQLTHLGDRESGSPAWSPDGKSIAFDSQTLADGIWHVMLISSEGGQPHRLTNADRAETAPSFSADGKWVYYSSSVPGGSIQVWRAPAQGGVGSQVTSNGGAAPMESSDGHTLYYLKGNLNAVSELWARPTAGGEEHLVVKPIDSRARWIAPDGVYYIPPSSDRFNPSTNVYFHRFATGKSEQLAKIQEYLYLGLTLTPDRKSILYSGFTHLGQSLMLVENFR